MPAVNRTTGCPIPEDLVRKWANQRPDEVTFRDTLERLRRYAIELQYLVPEQEEQEIWRVFGAQSPEMRAGMLNRYEKTGKAGFGVAEEAASRFT